MRLRSNKVYNEESKNIPRYVCDVETDDIVFIRDAEFIDGQLVYTLKIVTKELVYSSIRPFLGQYTLPHKAHFNIHAKEIRYAYIFEELITTGRIIPPWRSENAIAQCVDDGAEEILYWTPRDPSDKLRPRFYRQKR